MQRRLFKTYTFSDHNALKTVIRKNEVNFTVIYKILALLLEMDVGGSLCNEMGVGDRGSSGTSRHFGGKIFSMYRRLLQRKLGKHISNFLKD